MSSIRERHSLRALLDEARDPSDPWDFLVLLAACEVESLPDVLERGLALARTARPDPAGLGECPLGRAQTDPPADPDDRTRWLIDIETCSLAYKGWDRLLSPWVHDDLFQATAVVLAAADWGADPSLWDLPIVATTTRVDRNASYLPWSRIRSRSGRGLLVADRVDVQTLSAWLDHRLHAEDVATVRAFVREPGAWRTAYRSAIAELSAECHVTPVDSDRSISAAADESEYGVARRVFFVELPHLSDGASYEARLHRDGILWRFVGAEGPIAITPLDVGRHVWGDDVLGEIATTVHAVETTELALAEDALYSLEQLADGVDHPRAEAIGIACARALGHGSVADALGRAALAFTQGRDEGADDEAWATIALRTRLALQVLADRNESDALQDAIVDADLALAPHRDAVLIFDRDEYQRMTDGVFLDPDAWYAAPEWLEANAPGWQVDAALAAMRETAADSVVVPFRRSSAGARRGEQAGDASAQLYVRAAAASGGMAAHEDTVTYGLPDADLDDVRISSMLGEVFEALRRRPAVWLNADVMAYLERLRVRHASLRAELDDLERRLAPLPGAAALLTFDLDRHTGLVLEVRLRHEPGAGLGVFPPIARDAIRRAYDAVAALCPVLPPYPLDDHCIEILGLGAHEHVDGASLALPLALAFVSLWTDRSLPADLAATGDLQGRSPHAVKPVSRVVEKATELSRLSLGRNVRLLCHADNVDDARAGGARAESVGSVDEALQVSGLERTAIRAHTWGDERSRRALLRSLTDQVRGQALQDFVAFEDPWQAIALRMELLLRSMPPGPDDDDVVTNGRIHAALAYTHAGDPERAHALLAPLDDATEVPARLAVMRSVIELGNAIDRADWTRCDDLVDRLDDNLASCSTRDRNLVLGFARGGQGRARLHEGRVAEALPLLEEAVAWHARELPREVSRSRIHLASALRVAGRATDAMTQLELAADELQFAAAYSSEGAEHTRMFLQYERARTLIDLDRPIEAELDARAALERAQLGGFWPQLGILRTLAWAHRLLGDTIAADVCVEFMARLDVGTEHEALRRRLIDEANGMPGSSGEVY